MRLRAYSFRFSGRRPTLSQEIINKATKSVYQLECQTRIDVTKLEHSYDNLVNTAIERKKG